MFKEMLGIMVLVFLGAFVSNIDRIEPWLEKKIKRLGKRMMGV